MKIRCINCGHDFKLDDAYYNYAGEIKCWVCGSVFEIRMQEGMLKSSRHVRPPQSMPEEII